MAFPRYVDKLWSEAKNQINAIGDYFETLCATVIGRVTRSITTDVDGKAQLVNDLTDAEILPNLVYGTDENGARGWKTGAQLYYEKHTVTAGEAASGVIDLTGGNTYTTGNNSLCVYRMGVLQCITEDYAETDNNTVTFGAAVLEENDILIFRWTK